MPQLDLIASRRKLARINLNTLTFNEKIEVFKTHQVNGTENSNGYLQITFDGTKILRHRYMYQIFHGCPIALNTPIDHINQNKKDNRISNLRLSTAELNNQNKGPRSDNQTGRKGISKTTLKNGETWYTASITFKGQKMRLTHTQSLEEATAAYNKKAQELNQQHHANFALNKTTCSTPITTNGRRTSRQVLALYFGPAKTSQPSR